MRRWFRFLFQLCLISAVVGIRVFDPSFLIDQRLRTFDYYQRLKPRSHTPVPIRIVDLDDQSLERLGQWPWPRILLADLVDRLNQAGAAAIVFDAVFAEPDRTSPARIFELWPNSPIVEELRTQLANLPSHDAIFARSLESANVVLGFALTPGGEGRRPKLNAGFAFAGDDPRLFVPSFGGSVVNVREIAAAATGIGSIDLLPDRDGIVRRIPLALNFRGQIYPSIPAEALRVAQGASTYVIKTSGASSERSFGSHTGIVEIKIGRIVVPTDSAGQIWLYQTRAVAERTVPAWRILASDFDPASIEGSIVMIGTSAAGLAHTVPTPLNPAAPGVQIHAQIVDQILAGEFLTRPDWADGAEILFIAIIGVARRAARPSTGSRHRPRQRPGAM